MNKKAFTLIEIIVSISIISLISITLIVGINYINKNKLNKKIEKVSSIFDNALNTYLSEHAEIYENLSENVEGAVVTLELLKNEGLIQDNIIDPNTNKAYDYKNNYYVLSDAVLLNDSEDEAETECNGRVEISVLRSWKDISDAATENVIYICPKSSSSENDSKTKELEDRVSKLETMLQKVNMGGNNYVIFDVNSDSSQLAYFDADSNIQDLWRFVSNNGNNNITLMYNQNIKTNYSKIFPPKVSDFEKLSDKEYEICINNQKIKAKEVNLGEYLSYEPDDAITATIYKNGNDYYRYLYMYGGCEKVTKINDIESYLFNNSYKRLMDNSSFLSYYFKNSKSGGLNFWKKTDEMDYISLFNLNKNNPFKDALYNSINSNLKSFLVKSTNPYLYSKTGDNKYIHETSKIAGFNATYFRTLTKSEAENNKSWLVSYNIPLGIYVPEGTQDATEISYINQVASNDGTTTLNYVSSVYGEISINSNNIVSYIKTKTVSNSTTNAYSIRTKTYNPVIDLKNATLLMDYSLYSNNYKSKYTNCDTSKLGTYDCPYLLKFTNGYYSDGTNN